MSNRDYAAELAVFVRDAEPYCGMPQVPRDDDRECLLTLEYGKLGMGMAASLVYDGAGGGIPLAAAVALCESWAMDYLRDKGGFCEVLENADGHTRARCNGASGFGDSRLLALSACVKAKG